MIILCNTTVLNQSVQLEDFFLQKQLATVDKFGVFPEVCITVSDISGRGMGRIIYKENNNLYEKTIGINRSTDKCLPMNSPVLEEVCELR